MGSLLAFLYANIEMRINEKQILIQKNTPQVALLRHRVNNQFGIFIPIYNTPEGHNIHKKYNQYYVYLNAFRSLTWEFSTLISTVSFLDLTITILTYI